MAKTEAMLVVLSENTISRSQHTTTEHDHFWSVFIFKKNSMNAFWHKQLQRGEILEFQGPEEG